jgi:hypothetical protein
VRKTPGVKNKMSRRDEHVVMTMMMEREHHGEWRGL